MGQINLSILTTIATSSMSIALFVCKVSINTRGNEKAINKGEMRLMDEIVGGTQPQTMARRQKNNSSRRGQNISESQSEARVNKTTPITLASCQNISTLLGDTLARLRSVSDVCRL